MTCLIGSTGCGRRGKWEPGGTATPLRDGRPDDLVCWWGEPPCHRNPQRITTAVQELWWASVSLACPQIIGVGTYRPGLDMQATVITFITTNRRTKEVRKTKYAPGDLTWPDYQALLGFGTDAWSPYPSVSPMATSRLITPDHLSWTSVKIGLVPKSCYTPV